MISKKDVTQYVPKDNCLVSWGGTDNYEYRFVPEAKRMPATPAEAANAGDDDKKVSKWCTETNCHGSKDSEYVRWEHYDIHTMYSMYSM